MKIGIDWTQASTKRGAVMLAGGVVSLLFLTFGTVEQALAVMTIAGTVSGALGVGAKD